MGARWAQDGPRDGFKIELKLGSGVKNSVLALLNRSAKLLEAILHHLIAKIMKDEIQERKCAKLIGKP